MKLIFALSILVLASPAFAEMNFQNCMNAQEAAQLATAKAQITCQYEEIAQSTNQSQTASSRCETDKADAKSATIAAEFACSEN